MNNAEKLEKVLCGLTLSEKNNSLGLPGDPQLLAFMLMREHNFVDGNSTPVISNNSITWSNDWFAATDVKDIRAAVKTDSSFNGFTSTVDDLLGTNKSSSRLDALKEAFKVCSTFKNEVVAAKSIEVASKDVYHACMKSLPPSLFLYTQKVFLGLTFIMDYNAEIDEELSKFAYNLIVSK